MRQSFCSRVGRVPSLSARALAQCTMCSASQTLGHLFGELSRHEARESVRLQLAMDRARHDARGEVRARDGGVCAVGCEQGAEERGVCLFKLGESLARRSDAHVDGRGGLLLLFKLERFQEPTNLKTPRRPCFY